MNTRLYVVEPNAPRRRLVAEAACRAGLDVAGATSSLAGDDVIAARNVEVFLVAADAVASEPGALADLAGQHSDASIVLFGARPDLPVLLDAAPSRIRGYLTFNHLSDDEFIRSLGIIAHGGAVIEPLSAALLLDHLAENRNGHPRYRPLVPSTELTLRETEVVEAVRRGLSNKEIGRELSISLGTVRAHLRSIFRKLEVTSRAGAATRALAQHPQHAELARMV